MFLGRLQIQFFDLLSCPGRSAQKFQAGFKAGVFFETIDGYAPAQLSPAVLLHELSHHHFECDPMQGIVGLWV